MIILRIQSHLFEFHLIYKDNHYSTKLEHASWSIRLVFVILQPIPEILNEYAKMAEDKVILVDISDRPIGIMEKMEAHQSGGKLHRAFSAFVFNKKNELLLQRRALD